MSAMKKMVRIVVAAVVLFVTGAGVMAGPIYVESIGSSGNHADHFMTPQGIAVDAAGDVYVADSGTGYVQKLTLSDGRLAFVWSSWSHGLDYPKFSIALGMAVDSGGNLYVGDTGPRVQKIAETAGSLSNVWTYTGTGGTGYYASGLAVDSASNVYVADKGNNRILKLGQSGGNASLTWSLGSIGIGAGQFQYPEGVAVDSGGNLYVLDTGNGRIQKFSQSGGGVAWEWSYGTQGSGAGQFANPSGIAVSTGGSVYVADTANNRVVKLTQAGGSLAYEWACGGDPAYPGGYLQSGTGDGQFFSPFDIAVDSVGNMYVADSSNNRIQRWFDSEAVAPGGTMSIDTIVVHTEARLGNVLLVTGNRRLDVTGRVVIEAGASLTVEEGTVAGGVIEMTHGGHVYVTGSISSQLASNTASELHATGDADLGDAARYNGFSYEGQMFVGPNHVTLQSKGLAALGVVTEINGGTRPRPTVLSSGRAGRWPGRAR